MKKNYYLILIAFIISSCKRECKESTQATQIIYKPAISSILLYKGYEKIKFLHNNMDTIIFYGQGIKTDYTYTSTQDDCPSKVPLENKYLIFLDSANNYSFVLQLYATYQDSTYCKFNINNKPIYNGYIGDIILYTEPYLSLDVNGIKYDSLVYKENSNNYFYYKTNIIGMIKFKSNDDVFELIP